MIPMTCPACGREHSFSETLRGLTMVCKGCGGRLPIPKTKTDPAPADSPALLPVSPPHIVAAPPQPSAAQREPPRPTELPTRAEPPRPAEPPPPDPEEAEEKTRRRKYGLYETAGAIVGVLIASQVGPSGGFRAWKAYAIVFGLLGAGLGWLLEYLLDFEDL
jgi:hypothetical protein